MGVPHIFAIFRPQFWIISLVPGVFGVFLAGGGLWGREAFLVGIVLSALSAMTELVNNYEDLDQDRFQKIKKLGPVSLAGGAEVDLSSSLGVRKVLAGVLFFGFVSLMGAYALSLMAVVVAGLGVVIAVGYSWGPIRTKERGFIGVLTIMVGRGFLSFLLGWVAIQNITVESIGIGLFLTLLNSGSAILPQLSDFEEDRRLGILTFPVQVGYSVASKVAAGGIFLGLVVLGALAVFHVSAVGVLAVVPLVLGVRVGISILGLDSKNGGRVSKVQIMATFLFLVSSLAFL